MADRWYVRCGSGAVARAELRQELSFRFGSGRHIVSCATACTPSADGRYLEHSGRGADGHGVRRAGITEVNVLEHSAKQLAKFKEKLKRADLSTNMAQAHARYMWNATLDGNHCCNNILQQHC